MKIYHRIFEASIGELALLSTESGLCYIGFAETGDRGERFTEKYFPEVELIPGGKFNSKAEKQITDYLEGRLREFTVALDLRVDGFNREALQQVKSIPYGEVRTYGEIAAAVGRPKAARAVGNANRLNPIPLIIPCHRVVAAHGLGGYGGGLTLKKRLLRLEGLDVD